MGEGNLRWVQSGGGKEDAIRIRLQLKTEGPRIRCWAEEETPERYQPGRHGRNEKSESISIFWGGKSVLVKKGDGSSSRPGEKRNVIRLPDRIGTRESGRECLQREKGSLSRKIRARKCKRMGAFIGKGGRGGPSLAGDG